MKIEVDPNNVPSGKNVFFEGMLLVIGESSGCNLWDYGTLQEQLELLAAWLIEKQQSEEIERLKEHAESARIERIKQRRQALKVVR